MNDLNEMFAEIGKAAEKVASLLETHQRRIVFAESCTAGLVAASLARIPGISSWLCGSTVTYQESVKQEWIDVEQASLEKHSAVSDVVTRQMAINVLKKTKVAELSAAVTGHLGPDAPPELDGVCFVAVAIRDQGRIELETCIQFNLQQSERVARQLEATDFVLENVARYLESIS